MKCFILYSLSKSQLPCVFTRLDCWLRGLMASKDVLWAVYAGSICLWSWCHPMPSQLWARRAPGAGWCHRSGKTCDGLWRLPCWGSQPLAEFSQCASPPMFWIAHCAYVQAATSWLLLGTNTSQHTSACLCWAKRSLPSAQPPGLCPPSAPGGRWRRRPPSLVCRRG